MNINEIWLSAGLILTLSFRLRRQLPQKWMFFSSPFSTRLEEILNEAPHGQSPPINFRVAWPIKTRPHGQSPLIKFRVVWPIKIRPWKLFSGCNVETTLPAHADPQDCNCVILGFFSEYGRKLRSCERAHYESSWNIRILSGLCICSPGSGTSSHWQHLYQWAVLTVQS